MSEQPDLSRLKPILVTSGIQESNPALYQTIDGLIVSVRSIQDILNTDIASVTGISGAIADAVILTGDDESVDLINSRQLIAGANVTFDDSVANTRTISVHAPVTLAGHNYLTLVGQVITANDVVLGTQTSGNYTQSVSGTAGRISVSGAIGEGQAAIINIDTAYIGQNTITTLGTITTGVWNGTDISLDRITQIAGLSVLGVTGNVLADMAAITAGTDNQVLRRSGTTLAFGAVNLASSNAITGDLPLSNLTPASSASILLGRGSASAGDFQEITLGSGLVMTGTVLSSPDLGGDVVGPAGATDNAIARFDGATGKLIQNSGIIISDINDLFIPALAKLYIDGGNNTYIYEPLADRIEFVANGAGSFALDNGAVWIPAGNKFYLDGKSDTYIYESAANSIQYVVGGIDTLTITNTLFIYTPGGGNRFHVTDTVVRLPSGTSLYWNSGPNNGGTDDVRLYRGATDLLSTADNIAIPTTFKLYLDGGVDTYITESAANTISFITDGTTRFIIGSSDYISVGTTTATVGIIRITYNNYLTARNLANTDNIGLIGLATINGTANTLAIGDGGQALTYINGSTLAIGTLPALNGVIRIPYSNYLTARNSTNADNIALIGLATIGGVANTLALGDGGQAQVYINGGNLVQGATTKHYFDGGSNTYIYESTADTIAIVTGGITRTTINSTGQFIINGPASGNGFFYQADTNNRLFISDAAVKLPSGSTLIWNSGTNFGGTDDVGISRGSAGLINIGNATAGDSSGAIGLTTVYVNPTGRVYFDGGSNTYIWESVADRIEIVTAGAGSFAVDNGAAWIPATNKFYIDGKSNTYIYEASADNMQFVIGANTHLILTAQQIQTGNIGSAATPAICYFNDSNTGIFFSGADDVSISTGGTERVKVGSGSIALSLPFTFSSSISPSFSGTQNDYNPTNWATANYVRLTGTASPFITGFLAGNIGEIKQIINIGSTTITLAYDSASSSAANRILNRSLASVTLSQYESMWLIYDGTLQRWILNVPT